MLETLLITFREGLEAFLIVAIMLAYLAQTGRQHLSKSVYGGIGVALLISATTGWHIAELADNPATEGILSLIAGALVASLTFYVMKTAKTIKQSITGKIDNHAEKDGMAAAFGIFLFTVIMITREGMETALMLGALSTQIDAATMLTGAALGILATAIIGYFWVTQSHRINLRIFMQATGIFLILFAAHLFLYGIYELAETPLWPFAGGEELHNALRPYASGKSLIGQITIYGLLALPCAWLLVAYVRDKCAAKSIAAE